jgi:arginase family enzyme
MEPLDELALLLRPAGGGLHLVSTGRAEQEALARRLYGAATQEEVATRFYEALARIPSARAFVLGVPSDVGAGFRRGANLGPQAIRARYLEEHGGWPDGVVDLGDVFVVPQLLHDEMLSDAQLQRTRRAIYPDVEPTVRETLPVSPLSIEERALDLVFALNPRIAPVVLGGDHSTAWPVAAALSRAHAGERWAIVQPDAHTDLLEERLGVPYCFATWSFHANELLGRDGRLVQVGTRASRFDRGHWESALGVRQFWAEECRRDPDGVLDRLVQHLREHRVTGVYFSNDIDGTDAAFADATGTPEPNGLDPELVVALIRRLGRELGLIAGDVMEVAPPLRDDPRTTVRLATRYLHETVRAILDSPPVGARRAG